MYVVGDEVSVADVGGVLGEHVLEVLQEVVQVLLLLWR